MKTKRQQLSGLLFGLFMLVSYHSVFAQGNLQFNQVLNVEFSSTTSTIMTVPADKVWKLENLVMTSINNYACFSMNGVTYYLRQHNTSSSSWDNFPLWIASNKTITFGAGCASGMISIIEFNVVP